MQEGYGWNLVPGGQWEQDHHCRCRLIHPSTRLRAHFSSSLCIVNDELFVREASPSETQSAAFFIPVPTASASSVCTLSQELQEMVQAFSTQSGMKLEWSQK